MSKVIGIIPARKGSQSVVHKNFRNFHGKPLISWTIELALKSNLDRVIVSSDDINIIDYAKNLGAEAPFIRPKNLSEASTPIEPVIKHVYEYLIDKEKYKADAIALLLPTSPFRLLADINSAVEIYEKEKPTSVVSVSIAEANYNPHWMLVEKSGSVSLFNGKKLSEIKDRRQDLPEVFIRNDFIYLMNPKNLYETPPNLYGDKVHLLKIEEHRYDIDINSEKDWTVAENLFEYINKKHE